MYPILAKYGVSSPWGPRPNQIYGFHYGVDMPTPVGVEVPAISAGVVYFEGWIHFTVGGVKYSEIICVVNRDDGYADVYDHLSRTIVNEGDKVVPGTILGNTGATGYVTGPHLHVGKLKSHYKGGLLNNYGWVDITPDLKSWGGDDVTTKEFCKTILDLIEDNPNYEAEKAKALAGHVGWIEGEWNRGNPSAHRHWARGIMANNKVLGRNAMAEHLAEDARRLKAAQSQVKEVEVIKEVEVVKEVPVQDPVATDKASKYDTIITALKALGVIK